MPVKTDKTTRQKRHLYHRFHQVSRQFPDQIALVASGGLGNSYTYAEVDLRIRQLATGLRNNDLVKQPMIGLLSENRPEWAMAYLAILAAGGTVVPIDANLKPLEIAYIVGHAKIEVVVCSGCFEKLLKESNPALKLVSFDVESPNHYGHLLDPPPEEITSPENDTAALIYTSGTTGDPKAVLLMHQNLISNLEGIKAALKFDENDTFLSVLPLHHTFEATCGFLTPLMSGSTIVYARTLKSKEIMADIQRSQATIMCGVPLLFEKMYHTVNRAIGSAPPVRRVLFRILYMLSTLGWRFGMKPGKTLFKSLREKAGVSSIRMFVSGGAAIPPKISAFFNHIGFDFMQGYGMTECSPVISVNLPGNIRFDSVGPLLPGVEVRINEPNAAEIGEIIVRGDNVSPGYKDNPEKTAELLRDGWLYTGDLGRLTGGHLYITGRAKNIIISAAGKNIYPEEIEENLNESSFVMEAVVFGRSKVDRQGEEVCAVIVPDCEEVNACYEMPTGKPDMEKVREVIAEVVSCVNAQMADYKRISSFDIQLEELEKTSTRKVKRFLYE